MTVTDVEDLASELEGRNVPAISLAVARHGVIDARTWGVADASTGADVAPETPFQAGSVSKPVAAMAALRLVGDGRIDLDEDVNTYLRSWTIPAVGSWQPRITLRHLLSHTAGLTVHGFPGYERGTPVPTPVDVLDGAGGANTAPVRVDMLPGLQFRYSGGGYTIVQVLIEDVTGMPFADAMADLVLRPAGMDSSTYAQDRQPHFASGHTRDKTVVAGSSHVYPEQAAAGLWTTASDLCRFAAAVQRAAAGTPGALLPPAVAQEMLSGHGHGLGGDWGLGLTLRREGQARRFGHGGRNHGFIADLVAAVDGSFAYAAMCNGDDRESSLLLVELRDAVAVLEGWPDYTPAAPDRAAQMETPRLTGRFTTNRGVDVVITPAATGGLQVGVGAQPALGLTPISLELWLANELRAEVQFELEGHTAIAVVIRQRGESIRAPRTDDGADPAR